MRVTNEQVKVLACCEDVACEENCPASSICPVYTMNDDWEITIETLATDLLEARELLKEAVGLLKRIEPCDCDNDICVSMRNERESILGRTKEYAE